MITIKESMSALKNNSEIIIKKLKTKTKLNTTDEVVLLPLSLINRTTEPFVSLNPVDEAQRLRLEESIKKLACLKVTLSLFGVVKSVKKQNLYLLKASQGVLLLRN